MTHTVIVLLQQVHKKLQQIESGILVGTFLMTLMIAVTQIILRNVFDIGIIWADTFLRIAVLWLGMMGALVASRKNNHINMDLGQKYLSGKVLSFTRLSIHLFTATICFLIAWYGLNLVQMEYEEAGLAFANIPIWISVSIIPIAFMIMGLRYVSLALLQLGSLYTGRQIVAQQSRLK